MNITTERISLLAKKNKVSDQELCRVLGAKKDKIYTWREDRSTPTTDEVAILVQYFNVSADYLLGLTDIQLAANPHEQALLEAYRNHSELQEAVDRVLGIDRNVIEYEKSGVKTAAYSIDSEFPTVKKPPRKTT